MKAFNLVGPAAVFAVLSPLLAAAQIPVDSTGLGWLIGPFVTSIPRESLELTLQGMRNALTAGG
jgi:hypothetical protein